MLNRIIRFFLENQLVTFLLLVLLTGWGLVNAPFDWAGDALPRNPVAVDAIPNIGENQQIVFTRWPGRSPQDMEDQVSYPLTTALLGLPGVKTIRSSSMFGFSSIYIIFEEGVEFYWSRSRILEKLNALPAGTLPDGVQPALGPDATALGQIFWYTLEGRDSDGNPTGGWDLQELRSLQDFYVRYGLSSAEGVAEVASIGGFVKEYQIDIDPDALKAHGVTLQQVIKAVQQTNLDVGARTLEINQAEYFVRGLGYIKKLEDLEEAVVAVRENVPIRLRDVAFVATGPAERRGVLDKSGAEVVGGVVVARYGANPMQVIEQVKVQIEEIAPGLPSKTLQDGTVSQVTIVPFYDRTELIRETLGTLEEALTLEMLITIIVVVVMVVNLRASLLISSLLPLAVLMVFILMKGVGVDANIVSLSGIAIAIGTIVDVGIIFSENMLKHLDARPEGKPLLEVIYEAAAEVSSAILTAVMTTIISFIPVFSLQAAEGKLFTPLAFTKTFALLAAIFITMVILPSASYWIFGSKIQKITLFKKWADTFPLRWKSWKLTKKQAGQGLKALQVVVVLCIALWFLSREWLPLGAGFSLFTNFFWVGLMLLVILGTFRLFRHFYPQILSWCLANKGKFLVLPSFILLLGLFIWIGFAPLTAWLANGMEAIGLPIRKTAPYEMLVRTFPGIGEEFMPTLDEGAFLLMPTSMPHAGMAQNKEVLQLLDMAVTAIPEVESVVGKLGRVESALDPAPTSMYENVINYKSEYVTDGVGNRLRFKQDDEGRFLIWNEEREMEPIEQGREPFISAERLVKDEDGSFFRQWRNHIQSPDDIWQEIVKATRIPGVTSAPKLQPIETRLVMLQTGMRAPMGIKVKGPDLKTIEQFGFKLEKYLKEVPSVKTEAVFAERIVGKPYIEIMPDRRELARYGLTVTEVQNLIEVAIGGMPLTSTVEGRERYPVRVRYARELRNTPEKLAEMLVSTPGGAQIPLGQLAEISYTQGPQMIKSEDTFLTGYVLFDRKEGFAEVEVVEEAQAYLLSKIEAGELTVPAGISYRFSGSYENQVRAEQRLSVVIPLCLFVIFIILYLQFRSVRVTLMVFSGIAVAFSGGFLMLWLYGQEWFLDFSLFEVNFRDLFQVKPINLSVAVWVGFIALFGIATDDGVLIATYLQQAFKRRKPQTLPEIREAVKAGGMKRVRPALMTTATTLVALLPVITSTGRGSDVMVPMAIPAFGGMTVALITLLVVPVLYAMMEERNAHQSSNKTEE